MKKLPAWKPQPRNVYLTVYDEEGKILHVVSCPPDHVALQKLNPGESMLMGRGSGVTQKVVRQGCCPRIVNKTPAEMAALKKANPRLRFDSGE